jgi:AraC family transcriptional regulator, regulatory protein of adaptative response / DNA-3-methyladenine glycosylase II
MNVERCYRAIASRDRRFEGRFVVAVRTTGVYCRPGCPAPIPLKRNVRFFLCAAAAEEAGFRPCMRCRPDSSPGSAAWLGTSATVLRALKLIEAGGLDETGVDSLADRLGVGARHLRRLFAEQVGASPDQIARTRRAHFARKLIEETALPMSEVAHAAGYASIRRFNAAIRDTFRKPPTELRRVPAPSDARLTLRLPFKGQYDWAAMMSFLGARALPGVEEVSAQAWRRHVGDQIIEVRPADQHLELEVPYIKGGVRPIVERVRRVFDLGADPLAIADRLGRDQILAPLLRARPGLRVPGCWDPFEIAVRAILGQQVSVAAARTFASRLVARCGRFPTPEWLADADLSSVGLVGARQQSLRALARAVRDGALSFESDRVSDALCELPGIGRWTAGYIAMRSGDPDGWPDGDLGLRRALNLSARDADALSQSWTPFRAYAAMHLWMAEVKQ